MSQWNQTVTSEHSCNYLSLQAPIRSSSNYIGWLHMGGGRGSLESTYGEYSIDTSDVVLTPKKKKILNLAFARIGWTLFSMIFQTLRECYSAISKYLPW